jgi:hypothetical protein
MFDLLRAVASPASAAWEMAISYRIVKQLLYRPSCAGRFIVMMSTARASVLVGTTREVIDFFAPQLEAEQCIDDRFASGPKNGREAEPRMEQRRPDAENRGLDLRA